MQIECYGPLPYTLGYGITSTSVPGGLSFFFLDPNICLQNYLLAPNNRPPLFPVPSIVVDAGGSSSASSSPCNNPRQSIISDISRQSDEPCRSGHCHATGDSSSSTHQYRVSHDDLSASSSQQSVEESSLENLDVHSRSREQLLNKRPPRRPRMSAALRQASEPEKSTGSGLVELPGRGLSLDLDSEYTSQPQQRPHGQEASSKHCSCSNKPFSTTAGSEKRQFGQGGEDHWRPTVTSEWHESVPEDEEMVSRDGQSEVVGAGHSTPTVQPSSAPERSRIGSLKQRVSRGRYEDSPQAMHSSSDADLLC
jgi:hypothetical protein